MRKHRVFPMVTVLAVGAFGLTACSGNEEEPVITEEPPTTEATPAWRDVPQVENPRSGFISQDEPDVWFLNDVGYCSLLPGDFITEVGAFKQEGYNDGLVVQVTTKEPVVAETDTRYCAHGEKVVVDGDTFDRTAASPEEIVQSVQQKHDAIGRILQNPVGNPRNLVIPEDPYFFGYGATEHGVLREIDGVPTAETVREHFKQSRLCYVMPGQKLTELGEYDGEVLVRYDLTKVKSDAAYCDDNTIFFLSSDKFAPNGDVENDVPWGESSR